MVNRGRACGVERMGRITEFIISIIKGVCLAGDSTDAHRMEVKIWIRYESYVDEFGKKALIIRVVKH